MAAQISLRRMQQSRVRDVVTSRSPVNRGADYSSPDTTNGSGVAAEDKPAEIESGKWFRYRYNGIAACVLQVIPEN